MIPLTLTMDLDRTPWSDAKPAGLGLLSRAGLLRHGTTKGNAAVMFLIEMPDGTMVAAQTTWALFRSAFIAFNASPIVAEEVMGP